MVMQSFVDKVVPDVMTEESFDALCAAVLLLCVTVAAPLFIYGGMQYAKYDIEEYNKENNPDKPFADRLMSAISGGIMLAATIVLFIMGFCFDNWDCKLYIRRCKKISRYLHNFCEYGTIKER